MLLSAVVTQFASWFNRSCILRCFSPNHTDGFLGYYRLPVTFNQPGNSPLTSLINRTFPVTADILFCFLALHCINSTDYCVCKSIEILKNIPSCTNNYTKSLKSP